MTQAQVEALGEGKLEVQDHGATGRIVWSDSISYGAKLLGTNDVFVVASYSGIAAFVHGLRLGVKALIGHDAGIGKDEAGINGLEFAERHSVPAAAASAATAALANGRTMMSASISRCNAAAARLGVQPGQSVSEAAQKLLAAPAGRAIVVDNAFDNDVHEVYRDARGAILASSSSFVFKQEHPNDVLCIASHTGRVFGESILKIKPRGAMANDAGMGLYQSGIGGLPMLQQAGIAGASVAAMSARIGDGMSTWRDGVISAVNELAAARGVKAGMRASDAALLMLG